MKPNNLKTIFAALVLASVTVASAQDAIRVTVDGNNVAFTDVQPMMRNGRVFVPVRGVFEYMNAQVKWDEVNRCVDAQRGEDKIKLPINSSTAVINGSNIQMDSPAIMVRGRAMIPLRFLSESMHAKVAWLESERMVTIDTKGPGAVPQAKPDTSLLMLLRSGI